MLRENNVPINKKVQCAQALCSLPFFIFFFFFKKIELLLLALVLLIPPLMHTLYYHIYLIVGNTSLVHSDLCYSASLLWRNLSYLTTAIILFALTHTLNNKVFLQRSISIHLALCVVLLLQRALLFLLTYNTIWITYLERIRESVICYQIFDGIIYYVKRKIPDFVLDARKRSERKKSVYKDALTGSFIASKHDIEAPDTTNSTALQQVILFTAPRVPLSTVHNAISDVELNRNDGSVLYESVLSALNTKVLGTKFTELNGAALREIFREHDLCAIAKVVLGGKAIVTESQFTAAFSHAVTQRSNLQCNLENYEVMMSTLNNVLTAISAVVMLFVILFICKLPVLKNGPLIISIFLALSIMFGSTLTRFFEGLVFVFMLRPINVGDVVFIKDEASKEYCFTVLSLHLLTTAFVRDDGQTVIMSNYRLKDAVIVNAYRSGPSTTIITVLLPPLTSAELASLEQHLGCSVTITAFEDSWTATIKVPHATNFQNMKLISNEHKRIRLLLMEFIDQRTKSLS